MRSNRLSTITTISDYRLLSDYRLSPAHQVWVGAFLGRFRSQDPWRVRAASTPGRISWRPLSASERLFRYSKYRYTTIGVYRLCGHLRPFKWHCIIWPIPRFLLSVSRCAGPGRPIICKLRRDPGVKNSRPGSSPGGVNVYFFPSLPNTDTGSRINHRINQPIISPLYTLARIIASSAADPAPHMVFRINSRMIKL